MYGQGQISPSPMKVRDPRAESELMEKVAALQREFSDIDINHDDWISRQELYSYLDRRSNTQFDRAIADEIFEHMDKDNNQQITINEFIKVYIEAEEMLRRKIEAAKINKESYKRQQEECLRRAEEERLNEKLTAYGIANNSMVHVAILEGKNLKPYGLGGALNPYVEISLDDQQRAKTKVIQGGPDVIWDEKATFDVVNPESLLKFTVYDSNNQLGDSFEGEVVVPLSELKDQNMHDVLLDLFDQNGTLGKGQLHVKLQWIHSKAKYFAMVAQKWYENYQKEDEELKEYERYLETLYLPFPGLQVTAKLQHQEQRPQAVNLEAMTQLDKQFLTLMNQAARKITKQENPNEGFWVQATVLLSIVEIVLAIFITFGRPNFFDLIFPIIIVFYLKHEMLRNVLTLKTIALAILGSIVLLDFIWMFIYTGSWTDYDTIDVQIERGVRRFVVFFSFVNVLLKFVIALLCYMLNLQFAKQRGSVPRVVMMEPSSQRNSGIPF